MATSFFQDEITSIFNQHHLHHHVGGLDSGFPSFDFPSGFMDLLGCGGETGGGGGGGSGGAMTFQDFYFSQPLPSLFDLIQPPMTQLPLPRIEEEENRLEKELPQMRVGEVVVGDCVPTTPNSSSISCSSNEGGREENDAGEGKGDGVAAIEEEDGKDKTKKL
ncbi:hypothetical protein MLD38_017948 [Melastoma candidum]|nr:hypothetical protein MLD38_017948 [Melastoma candidum]